MEDLFTDYPYYLRGKPNQEYKNRSLCTFYRIEGPRTFLSVNCDYYPNAGTYQATQMVRGGENLPEPIPDQLPNPDLYERITEQSFNRPVHGFLHDEEFNDISVERIDN